MVGESRLSIPGGETAGRIGASWFSRSEIDKCCIRRRHQVQPGFHTEAAASRCLGAGYSFRVVDPVAL